MDRKKVRPEIQTEGTKKGNDDEAKNIDSTGKKKHTTPFNNSQTQTFDFVLLFSSCSQVLFSCDTTKFDDASNNKKRKVKTPDKRGSIQ